MMPLFEKLLTDKCPFDDLPEKRRTLYSLTRDEMEECQWLKPLLVAQIEFTEWTPDGHLRHSSFAGLRKKMIKPRGRFVGNSALESQEQQLNAFFATTSRQ